MAKSGDMAWWMRSGVAMAALGWSLPGVAQDATTAVATDESTVAPQATAGDDEEVIYVTARRRDESLRDVPIAVTAYSGAELERGGALDITDIGDTTPNVTIEVSRGTSSTLTAFIRGVGQQDPVAGFEQGVGLYVDDIYFNRPQAALLDLYDVERIEVLRGPQGTLYGRNTIGGAIKYVTRRLGDEPRLRVRANVGTHEQADLIVSASTPLGGGLSIGAAAARLSHGGFGKNRTTGDDNYNKDIWGLRGTVEFDPSDSFFLRLSGDYTVDDSNPRGGHRLIPGQASGVPVFANEYDSAGGIDDPKQRVRAKGLALLVEGRLSDSFKLRSITGMRRDTSSGPIDFDALPTIDADIPGRYANKQFSQEVQLLVETPKVRGLLGVYYLDASARTAFDVRAYSTGLVLQPALPGLTLNTDADMQTKAWAIFGDAAVALSDRFNLSVGARYTVDRRKGSVLRRTYALGGSPEFGGVAPFDDGVLLATTSNFTGKRKDEAFTPRVSLSFAPNATNNLYLSYARGFKGGGFDPRGQTTEAPVQTPEGIYDYMAFEPETVDSYELGWKGVTTDRRLSWAAAVFQANYRDVQIPASVGCIVRGVPTFCGVTANAGKARFRGVELEASWRAAESAMTVGDRLTLSGMLGFLDARYLQFDTIVAIDPSTDLPMAPQEMNLADYRKVQNTPKWTTSATVDYTVPMRAGRVNANATLSYRSSSQQFEQPIPGLDQKGFALLDANVVWTSANERWTVGLHGKNLTDTRYVVGGYNFFAQNPFTGQFINPFTGAPGLVSTVGVEGVLTAYYGNPRQIFVSVGMKL